MGNVCILTPLIKGDKSKFYLELYDYTGKDRNLTNLLYSISVQDLIIAKFDKSELNSQGEPKLLAFLEKMNIRQLLSNELLIMLDMKDMGLVDENGEPVYFETVDSILDRVIDYNDNNADRKALIQFVDGRFFVDIHQLDSENFGYNLNLKYNKMRFRHIVDYLQDLGFNTEFSEKTKKFFNPINSGALMTMLSDLSTFDNSFNRESLINEQTIGLMVDLFRDSEFVSRISKAVEDEMSIEEFIYIASDNQRINNYLNNIENEQEYQRYRDLLIGMSDTTKRFLRYSIDRLEKINIGEVLLEIDDEARVIENDETLGVDNLDIKYTLNDLYKTFHIDQDVIESTDVRLKKLSDLANRLMVISSNRRDFDKKTNSETGLPVDIYQLQDNIRNARYASCCYDTLNYINTAIKEYKAFLERREKQGHIKDLAEINNISKQLMKMLGVVRDYEDVVSSMMDIEKLLNDGLDTTPNLMRLIAITAKNVYSEMGSVKNDLAKKLELIVYDFLRNYYSDQQNLAKPLEELLRLAEFDIGIFSRFVYSMHQCSDPVLATLGLSVKEQHEVRDDILREIDFNIRSITDKLYRSGSNTDFMFNYDKDGNVYDIQSLYDFQKYYEDREEYRKSLKEQGYKKYQINRSMRNWDYEHRTTKKEFGVETWVPNVKKFPQYGKLDFLSGWTLEQIDYYNFMMNLKAEMIKKVGGASPQLYSAVQLTDTMLGQTLSGRGISGAVKAVGNKIKDAYKKRDDETDYGAFDDSQLGVRNIDPNGRLIMLLPLFYTHEIKDKSRITRDFSRAMMAYCSTSVNYYTMNEIMDSLLLTKDFLENRKVMKTSGLKIFASVFNVGKKQKIQPEYTKGKESNQGGLLDDYFDILFGKKKNEWTGTLFGHQINYDKATDSLIGATSTLGLTANFLGAEANLLVGKLLMLIESGMFFGGEFFNMKDMVAAEGLYFRNLPGILEECVSNNKKNKMALLMDEFDASENFYQDLALSGFYKNPIGKILGNKSLLFMYGMGEHLLHAEGMLACLNNIKVVKLDQNGKEIERGTLYDAFEVQLDESGRNGKIRLKEGYKYLGRDGLIKGDVNSTYIAKIKKNVKYVNKTMHGAFGDDDRGAGRKYAIYRMLMNFRQWMPEHYARRFRGKHYNAELGEEREGYYATVWYFVQDCVKGFKDNKNIIVTRWKEMSDMERYNISRVLSEVTMLAVMTALIFALTLNYDDKKKNWAYRLMIYELKRVQMETKASTPNLGFIDNALNILNQPFALIKTIQSLTSLFRFSNLAVEIESGKYEGENKYWHDVKKNTPFVGLIRKQAMLEEGMFSIFD